MFHLISVFAQEVPPKWACMHSYPLVAFKTKENVGLGSVQKIRGYFILSSKRLNHQEIFYLKLFSHFKTVKSGKLVIKDNKCCLET